LLPIRSFQCSTPNYQLMRRQPKSCFRENQLLQGSISFSLQPTSHPRVLNGSTVRASVPLSQHFTLLMGSSPCFGSYACYRRAVHTRFRCGSMVIPLSHNAAHIHSQAHSSIGTRSRSRLLSTAPTPCRHMVSVLFHSPLRGAFHRSLTVLVHYRFLKVCSLTG
jgi:hypothetical protein